MTSREYEAAMASLVNQIDAISDSLSDVSNSLDKLSMVDPNISADIAEVITFENCNEIAWHLMNTSHLNEAGKALFNELKYYMRETHE